MNKIIDGNRYDTKTATELGYMDNGYQTNDFYYFGETLCRTPKGNYFIHGYGGGNSKYGEWHGNSGGSGEVIQPIDESAAKKWAEEYLTGDEYEEIFGKVEENTRKQNKESEQKKQRKKNRYVR